MAEIYERRTVSFVVRLWQEPMLPTGEQGWRGQIEHIGSREAAHFELPAGLVAFLAAHLTPPASSESAGPAAEGSDRSEERRDA